MSLCFLNILFVTGLPYLNSLIVSIHNCWYMTIGLKPLFATFAFFILHKQDACYVVEFKNFLPVIR